MRRWPGPVRWATRATRATRALLPAKSSARSRCKRLAWGLGALLTVARETEPARATSVWIGAGLCLLVRPIRRSDRRQPDRPGRDPRQRLEQLFLAKVGIGPRAYNAHLRMEEARALVVQGRLYFKEIAAHLGFISPAAFTQAFIRHHGMSPAGRLLKKTACGGSGAAGP